MAGTLVIDTLKASSGVLATQNGMTGIAKAWVAYNGSTQTVIASFNVGSVTRTGTGAYTANFTTSMPSSSYAVSGSFGAQGYNLGYITSMTTGAVAIQSLSNGGVATDSAYISIKVFSA